MSGSETKVTLQKDNAAAERLPAEDLAGNSNQLPGTPWQKFRALLQKYKVGEFFQKYTMIIALFAVILVFYQMTDGDILNHQNINGLIMENAYVFVLATGMLLCILTGGNIDLSVGSVVCFTAAVGCVMMRDGQSAWAAMAVMLLIGLGVGLFQGFWIAKVRVPAFIATLAGMYAFRGFTNIVMNGKRVDIDNSIFKTFFGNLKSRDGSVNSFIPDFIREKFSTIDEFFNQGTENSLMVKLVGEKYAGRISMFNATCLAIGIVGALIFIAFRIRKILVQKKLGIKQSISGQIISMILVSFLVVFVCFKLALWRGFPWVLVWIALILGIYAYVTNKTAIGRHLYAVGGNEKATALSGVKTRNVFWFAYANIGFLAGFAGILTAGRLQGMDPTIGEGYEMDAIASCFIGGASAYGGTGKVSGMIIGALLMGVINKGMIIAGVDVNLQRVVKGLVLLVAVLFDVLSKRQKR